MGDLGDFPKNRDASSTTEDVAELVAALKLPTIVPLATDTIGMDALPPLPSPSSRRRGDVLDGGTSDSPDSQLTMAQQLMDHCISAIADLKKHQNQCAALAADLIERLHAGVSLEGGILAFDQWQLQNSLSGMQAELAMIMQIPEGSASRLMEHATVLVRELPATMEQLHQGLMGWEHAVVIAEEMALVQSCGVPQLDLDDLELQMLGKAGGSTLPSFREKARRVRERRFPESIVPRSRRAYADRQMTKSRARDGMLWLGLYAPAPTIEGIWDQCTATAQAAQGPHEDRTLTQLRADIAAALLLNQSLAGNRIFAPARRPPRQPPTCPTCTKLGCPARRHVALITQHRSLGMERRSTRGAKRRSGRAVHPLPLPALRPTTALPSTMGRHPMAGEPAQTLVCAPGIHRRIWAPPSLPTALQTSSCGIWRTFPPGLAMRQPPSSFQRSLSHGRRMLHWESPKSHPAAIRALSPPLTTRITLTLSLVASPTFGTRPIGFQMHGRLH